MPLYVIENINPNRDRYYNSNTGGNFIKSPGTREYHTTVEKATTFPNIARADKIMKEMISIHTSITNSTSAFAEDFNMSPLTCPDLKVRALTVTPRELNSTENAELNNLD